MDINAFGFDISNVLADTEENYYNPEDLFMEESIESELREFNALFDELNRLDDSVYLSSGTEANNKALTTYSKSDDTQDFTKDEKESEPKPKYTFINTSAKKEPLIQKIFGMIRRFFQRLISLFRSQSFSNYKYLKFTNIQVVPGYERFKFEGIPYKWIHEYCFSMKVMLNGVKYTSNFLRNLHKVTDVNDLKKQILDVTKELDKVHIVVDKPIITEITAVEITKGSSLLRQNKIDENPVFKYLALNGSKIDDWFIYKNLRPEAMEAVNSLSNSYYTKFKNIGLYLLQIRNFIIKIDNELKKAVNTLTQKYIKDPKFLRAFQPYDKKAATISGLLGDFKFHYDNREDKRINREIHKARNEARRNLNKPELEDDDNNYTDEFK